MPTDSSLECHCEFAPNIFIQKRRIHQVFGPARIRMLLFLAKKISGPIFWIKSPNEKIFLHPDGIYPWMNSSRVTFIYSFAYFRLKEVIVCNMPGIVKLMQTYCLKANKLTYRQTNELTELLLNLLSQLKNILWNIHDNEFAFLGFWNNRIED